MSDRQVIEAIQKLAGTQLVDEVYFVHCEVQSVNIAARTCDCTSISGISVADFPDVQLMAEVDDGFLLVPSVNSNVLVGYSKRLPPFIAQFSQIDQVIIITGNTSLSIKDGSVQFNDGSYGGLIQIKQLITKLNNLENLVNDLISKFNLHTHILTLTSGTGTAAPTLTQETSQLVNTNQNELENTLITHGKQLT